MPKIPGGQGPLISFDKATQAGLLDEAFVRANERGHAPKADEKLATASTEVIKGIGATTAQALAAVGIDTVAALVSYPVDGDRPLPVSPNLGKKLLALRAELVASRVDDVECALDPDAAKRLLESCRGWGEVGAMQARLLALVGGETNRMSRVARAQLAALTGADAWASTPPRRQAKILCGLLETCIAPADLTNAPPPAGGPQPAPFALTGPEAVAYHQFADTLIPAFAYTVAIDDREIEIILPHTAYRGAGLVFPTAEDIAETLASLPAASRGQVVLLQVNPFQNAADELWTTDVPRPIDATIVDGQVRHATTMWTDETGVVGVFPKPHAMSWDFLRNTVLHESGHVWSLRDWGYDSDTQPWRDWQAAMASDVVAASTYARTSPWEDVAETVVVYLNSRGTAEHDELRAIFPGRFALLDEALA